MILNVDFSLFHSPTGAFGRVTGEINASGRIAVSDEILILEPGEGDWFSGALRVTSVNELPGDSETVLVGLEDVVAPCPEVARKLVARLENEAGLFFDEYD